MEPQFRLQILLAAIFFFLILIFLMMILKSIGIMTHDLDRLEDVIDKEIILTRKQRKKRKKIDTHRKQAEHDRSKRQQSLLNVPLRKQDDSPESEGN
jgi:hypothetical protein